MLDIVDKKEIYQKQKLAEEVCVEIEKNFTSFIVKAIYTIINKHLSC